MINSRIACGYLYVISKHGYPPPADDTPGHLAQMKALGFTSVELEGIHGRHLTQVHAMRQMVAERLAAMGLRVPYFCVVLPGLGSADAAVRKDNLKLFELGCQTARTLGAKGVLDNAPLPPYRFPGTMPIVRHYDEHVLSTAQWPDNLAWADYWAAMIATYQQACDIAAASKLTYLMHPCLGTLSSTTDAYLYFRDAVGRDNLRFNLDTANQFAMKDNLNLSLVRLADSIDYIHISDNGGERVEHLPIGAGRIHWDGFFDTLNRIGYRGDFGIDIGGDESGVANLDEAYRNAIQWLNQRITGTTP